MIDARITAAALGICLTVAILYLVRRDQLHGPYAAWWLGVAAAALILSLFPELVIHIGEFTGIRYAPVLPIIVGLSFVMLRLLKLDIERSRQERQLRRLTQKLAILENELERLGGAPAHRDVES